MNPTYPHCFSGNIFWVFHITFKNASFSWYGDKPENSRLRVISLYYLLTKGICILKCPCGYTFFFSWPDFVHFWCGTVVLRRFWKWWIPSVRQSEWRLLHSSVIKVDSASLRWMERLPLISVELIQAHILNLMKNIIHMTLINSVCKTDSKIWLQISSETYYDDDDDYHPVEQTNVPCVQKRIVYCLNFAMHFFTLHLFSS